MSDAERASLTLVAAAIFLRGDQVLLTRRPEGSHLAGTWEFPGGKIEEGESPEEALVREIREELAIETEIVEPFRFVHHDYPEKRILLLTYLCRTRTDPEESPAGWRWVPIRELDDSSMPGADRLLVRTLQERCRS